MGIIITKLWSKLFVKKELKILILGLYGSGKTNIIYKLKTGEFVNTIPSIEFNVETFDFKNHKIIIWEKAGQFKLRPIIRHYYNNTDGLIFVVDSSDIDRIEEAKKELSMFLEEEELRDCAVLLMANKQDLNCAISPNEIANKLGLETLNRKSLVQGTSAVTGEGLKEGLDWIVSEILKKN